MYIYIIICMLFQQAAAPGVNVGLCGDNISIYCNISDKEPAGQPLLSRQTYSNL